MALTITELAAELRLGDGSGTPPDPIGGMLGRYLAAATTILAEHAPTAPAEVMDLAIIRYCGYVFDAPLAASNMTFANILVNSGAASILRDWRVPYSASIEGA